MAKSKNDQPEGPGQDKGDDVLRRLLKTPPKPQKKEGDSSRHRPPALSEKNKDEDGNHVKDGR